MAATPSHEQPPRVPRENVGARRVGRAGFLGLLGAGTATLFFGKQISNVTSAVTKPFADATGLSRLVPSGGWRIYTVAATMPTFDPATWRLRIDGLVRTPIELSYHDLLALPKVEQTSTFHCVTGWIVNGVRWGGVRFHDLLALAQPLPQAHAAHFISAEVPYDDYLSLDQVALPHVMLAYEMDGQPLLQEHGAPVRVVIPEMYGYKNVKWVERITLVPRVGAGYWENLGSDIDAWVGASNGYGQGNGYGS
jgi:DMSO/TMAO reductase YedYZ molybdopterin-dependent catalytic subunit